ncbi:hypothetical protein P7C70_g1952, partial [Phenoliferia sp. Uapishka_3]
MAPAAPTKATTKAPLKNRSISDFFSPVPSPSSSQRDRSQGIASSSPAPRSLPPTSKLATTPASKSVSKKTQPGPIAPPPSPRNRGKGKAVDDTPSKAHGASNLGPTPPPPRSHPTPPTSAISVSATGFALPPPGPGSARAFLAHDAMEVDSEPTSSSQHVHATLFAHTSPVKAPLPPQSFYSPPSHKVLRRPASPPPEASTSSLKTQPVNIATSSPSFTHHPDPFSQLSTPPRASRKSSEPSYTREISGSPLSSITDSPVKPKAKFCIAIQLGGKKRLPKTLGGSGDTIRRERSVTVADLDVFDDSPEKPKEVPEPTKKEEPVPDDLVEDIFGMLTGDLSDDDGQVITDSEDGSDDEDLQAMINAAKKKLSDEKAAGEPSHEIVSNISAQSPSADRRKSGRAVHPPKKPGVEMSARKATDASGGASKGKLGMLALQKDHKERQIKAAALEDYRRQFILDDNDDALVRPSLSAFRSTSLMFSFALQLHSDSDESDDFAGNKLSLETLTAENVDKMVSVAAAVAADGEYARSPEKKAAQEKAAFMADLLMGETRGTPALAEEDLDRVAWKKDVSVAPFVAPQDELGWKGSIAKAIRDGLKEPAAFPLPVLLFSATAGRGSEADQTDASLWLFKLVSHPSTPSLVAERAHQLLVRIIAYRALSAPHGNSSPLLTSQEFFKELERIGVKKEVINSPQSLAIEMDVEETPLPAGEIVTLDDRKLCLGRMLRVLQSLASASPRLLCGTDVASLSVCLVRLAVDPESAALRSSIERTLAALLRTVEVHHVGIVRLLASPRSHGTKLSTVSQRAEIVEELIAVYHSSSVRTRYEVVQVIPHETKSSKLLRKWLAWTMLADLADAQQLVSSPVRLIFLAFVPREGRFAYRHFTLQEAFAGPPALEDIIIFLNDSTSRTRTDHPFALSESMDDVALLQNTLLLTVTLTDLSDSLFTGNTQESRKNARLVQAVSLALRHIDTRIRTNVKKGNPTRNKAKNIIMRLEHALFYQATVILGIEGMELSIVDEEVDGAQPEQKRQRTLPQGQTTLQFARIAAPPPPTGPSPLTENNIGRVP